MTKSNDKRKFYLYIILGLLCWFILFNFAKVTFRANKNAVKSTFITSVDLLEKKSPEALLAYKILKEIENEDINTAMKYMEDFSYEYSDSYLKGYFDRFINYVMEKKDKYRQPIYFFNEMPVLADYMIKYYKESKINAENYAAVIPFYILKKYEYGNKGASNLCDIFIQNSVKSNHLTKKAAIILCLKIRRLYEEDGVIKNSERLKSIQDEIAMYKQLYPNELNDNPNFMDEIKWLDTFSSFLTDRINNPVIGIFTRITFNKNIKGLGE